MIYLINNLAKVAENIEKLDPTNSKERLETWKYAAEEIVDLLKTIRQEGEGGIVNRVYIGGCLYESKVAQVRNLSKKSRFKQ